MQLDPRILPDMGVKVTFLREADADAAPVAQQASDARAKAAAIKTENGSPTVTCSWSPTDRPSNAAPIKIGRHRRRPGQEVHRRT